MEVRPSTIGMAEVGKRGSFPEAPGARHGSCIVEQREAGVLA